MCLPYDACELSKQVDSRTTFQDPTAHAIGEAAFSAAIVGGVGHNVRLPITAIVAAQGAAGSPTAP